MKTNIATDSLQSQRLLRCGVSADTADMCWYKAKSPNKEGYSWMLISENYLKRRSSDEFVPAWSLSALLGLLPKEICDESGDDFYFSLAKEFPFSEGYGAAYIPCWHNGNAIIRKRDNNAIEACVQLIEWLSENGYKLNEI